MTKILAYVRSRESCAAVARELGLDARLRERGAELGGDEGESLSENRNVLAAVLEAVLAALFLEHGFEPIAEPIVQAFAGRIEYAARHHRDYKTELQELLARERRTVSYRVVEIEGPPHRRRFTCAATIGGTDLGLGSGRTKKEAEQRAARQALAALQGDERPGDLASADSEPF